MPKPVNNINSEGSADNIVDYDFILQHIRQEIAKKLFPTDAWQANFKTIVWPWIRQGKMPRAAWTRLNIAASITSASFAEQLKISLEAAFLSHGFSLKDKTTDNKKTIEEAIDIYCTAVCIVNIDCPPVKNPLIIKLSNFFKSLREKEKERKQIKILIKWLDFTFDPNNETHNSLLSKFFTVYEIANKITDYGCGLLIEGHGELLATLKSSIIEYFSNGFRISSVLQENIEDFNKIYLEFDKNKKPIWVDNFFVQWFLERFSDEEYDSNKQRALLFYYLCNPAYQKIIRMSNQEIEYIYDIFQGCINSNPDNNSIVEISVNIFNKCMLHALAVPIAEWSENFNEIMKIIYRFASNGFNEPGIQEVAGQLKKDSYPDVLLSQIKYLLDCYALKPNVPVSRPRQVALMPTVIETPVEAMQGIIYIGLASEYEGDINQLITSINIFKDKALEFSCSRLDRLLGWFKGDARRLAILNACVSQLVPQFSISKLITFLCKFSISNERLQALEILKDRVKPFLAREFMEALSLFDYVDIAVLEVLKDKLNLLSIEELETLLGKFQDDQTKLKVLKILKDKLNRFSSIEPVSRVLCMFSAPDPLLQALDILTDKMNNFSVENLIVLLSNCKTEQGCLQIIGVVKNKIARFSAKEVMAIFRSKKYCIQILGALKDKVSLSTEQLIEIFFNYSHNQNAIDYNLFLEFFNLLKDRTPNIVVNNLLKIFFKLVTDEDRLKVLSILADKLIELTVKDLLKIISKFASDLQLKALSMLTIKMPQITFAELRVIFSKFKTQERIALLEALKDKIPELSVKEFMSIFSGTPTHHERVELLNVLKDKLPRFSFKNLSEVLLRLDVDSCNYQDALILLKDKVLVPPHEVFFKEFSEDFFWKIPKCPDRVRARILKEFESIFPKLTLKEFTMLYCRWDFEFYRAIRELCLDVVINKVSEFSVEDMVALLAKYNMPMHRMFILDVFKDRLPNPTYQAVDTIFCNFRAINKDHLQAVNLLKCELSPRSTLILYNLIPKFNNPEIYVEILKEFFLAKNLIFSAAQIDRCMKATDNNKNGVDLLQHFSGWYIESASAQTFFVGKEKNRCYIAEVKQLNQLIQKSPQLTFDDAVEYLSRLLVYAKKQINFDDDLFVMVAVVDRAIQKQTIEPMAIELPSSAMK